MNEPTPKPGDLLVKGMLFRRIPNWEGRWDPDCSLPGKAAFGPGWDDEKQQRETGISTYLTTMTDPGQVLAGHDPSFGLMVIDIEELHAAVASLRHKKGVKPFGDFTVTFDPLENPKHGEARHAHCYIEPMPAAIQKELVRLTSPSRIVKPCGTLRPSTGSGAVTT